MATDKKWYFTKEQLASTPSIDCGYDADKEIMCRQQAAKFIKDMGYILQLNQLCINTAIVYMHRFYVFHSFTKFAYYKIAAAALFLAAKVEEQPRKLEDIIKVQQSKVKARCDTRSQEYQAQVQDLLFNENVLLQTLGFELAVHHPHVHVVRYWHLVRVPKLPKQISKSVIFWTFGKKIPLSREQKYWFQYVDETVSLKLLDKMTDEFIFLSQKAPWKTKARSGEDGGGHTSGHHIPHPPGTARSHPPRHSSSAARSDRSGRIERPDRQHRPNRIDRVFRPDRPPDRPDRTGRSDRPHAAGQAMHSGSTHARDQGSRGRRDQADATKQDIFNGVIYSTLSQPPLKSISSLEESATPHERDSPFSQDKLKTPSVDKGLGSFGSPAGSTILGWKRVRTSSSSDLEVPTDAARSSEATVKTVFVDPSESLSAPVSVLASVPVSVPIREPSDPWKTLAAPNGSLPQLTKKSKTTKDADVAGGVLTMTVMTEPQDVQPEPLSIKTDTSPEPLAGSSQVNEAYHFCHKIKKEKENEEEHKPKDIDWSFSRGMGRHQHKVRRRRSGHHHYTRGRFHDFGEGRHGPPPHRHGPHGGPPPHGGHHGGRHGPPPCGGPQHEYHQSELYEIATGGRVPMHQQPPPQPPPQQQRRPAPPQGEFPMRSQRTRSPVPQDLRPMSAAPNKDLIFRTEAQVLLRGLHRGEITAHNIIERFQNPALTHRHRELLLSVLNIYQQEHQYKQMKGNDL